MGGLRDLARKQEGSASRAKARLRVARIHARIADRRRDHLHKLTTRLVRENQTVVIEDLSVRNRYPSSKTCSTCGQVNTTLALNDRTWTCPGCATEHDRDINAAKSILAAGLAER